MVQKDAHQKLQQIFRVLIGEAHDEWHSQKDESDINSDTDWAWHLLTVHRKHCTHKDCFTEDVVIQDRRGQQYLRGIRQGKPGCPPLMTPDPTIAAAAKLILAEHVLADRAGGAGANQKRPQNMAAARTVAEQARNTNRAMVRGDKGVVDDGTHGRVAQGRGVRAAWPQQQQRNPNQVMAQITNRAGGVWNRTVGRVNVRQPGPRAAMPMAAQAAMMRGRGAPMGRGGVTMPPPTGRGGVPLQNQQGNPMYRTVGRGNVMTSPQQGPRGPGPGANPAAVAAYRNAGRGGPIPPGMPGSNQMAALAQSPEMRKRQLEGSPSAPPGTIPFKAQKTSPPVLAKPLTDAIIEIDDEDESAASQPSMVSAWHVTADGSQANKDKAATAQSTWPPQDSQGPGAANTTAQMGLGSELPQDMSAIDTDKAAMAQDFIKQPQTEKVAPNVGTANPTGTNSQYRLADESQMLRSDPSLANVPDLMAAADSPNFPPGRTQHAPSSVIKEPPKLTPEFSAQLNLQTVPVPGSNFDVSLPTLTLSDDSAATFTYSHSATTDVPTYTPTNQVQPNNTAGQQVGARPGSRADSLSSIEAEMTVPGYDNNDRQQFMMHHMNRSSSVENRPPSLAGSDISSHSDSQQHINGLQSPNRGIEAANMHQSQPGFNLAQYGQQQQQQQQQQFANIGGNSPNTRHDIKLEHDLSRMPLSRRNQAFCQSRNLLLSPENIKQEHYSSGSFMPENDIQKFRITPESIMNEKHQSSIPSSTSQAYQHANPSLLAKQISDNNSDQTSAKGDPTSDYIHVALPVDINLPDPPSLYPGVIQANDENRMLPDLHAIRQTEESLKSHETADTDHRDKSGSPGEQEGGGSDSDDTIIEEAEAGEDKTDDLGDPAGYHVRKKGKKARKSTDVDALGPEHYSVIIRKPSNTAESPQTSYLCKKCNMTCPDFSSLQTHFATHCSEDENDKKFICPTCKKSFSQKATLKYHMVTHSSARPYKCATCDRSFKLKLHLVHHMKCHTS